MHLYMDLVGNYPNALMTIKF